MSQGVIDLIMQDHCEAERLFDQLNSQRAANADLPDGDPDEAALRSAVDEHAVR